MKYDKQLRQFIREQLQRLIESVCPFCGDKNAYAGFNSDECTTVGCRNFSQKQLDTVTGTTSTKPQSTGRWRRYVVLHRDDMQLGDYSVYDTTLPPDEFMRIVYQDINASLDGQEDPEFETTKAQGLVKFVNSLDDVGAMNPDWYNTRDIVILKDRLRHAGIHGIIEAIPDYPLKKWTIDDYVDDIFR